MSCIWTSPSAICLLDETCSERRWTHLRPMPCGPNVEPAFPSISVGLERSNGHTWVLYNEPKDRVCRIFADPAYEATVAAPQSSSSNWAQMPTILALCAVVSPVLYHGDPQIQLSLRRCCTERC